VYEKQGELAYLSKDGQTALKKFSEALKIYKTSLEIVKSENMSPRASYLNIGHIYINLSKLESGRAKSEKLSEAENFLEKGLRIAKDEGYNPAIADSYFSLSMVDSIRENYLLAYENYKMHILYRDSVYNEESKKKSLQAKIQYEFDKKEDL